MNYEIYALKYAGPVSSRIAMVVYLGDWTEKVERAYYIWVVKGEGETVVFDSGVRPDYGREMSLLKDSYVQQDTMLERMGIKAAEVKHLVISHMHFDHCGGLELFPNAKVYIQRREFDFWAYDPIAKRPPFAGANKNVPPPWGQSYGVSEAVSINQMAELRGSDRLVLVDGDQEILPGIEIMLTPGHTPGLQSLAIETKNGIVVLASDSAHLQKNFEIDTPSCFITDMLEWLRSYSKLKEKVGGNLEMLFSGYDKMMLDKYPKIAEDITRLA